MNFASRVPLNFTHLRFGGVNRAAWEPQRLRIECTATRLFHGRFHGRDSTLPAIFAGRPHDARRKVR